MAERKYCQVLIALGTLLIATLAVFSSGYMVAADSHSQLGNSEVLSAAKHGAAITGRSKILSEKIEILRKIGDFSPRR